MTGVITAIKAAKGYGFIRPASGSDVFFHCYELFELPFDEQLIEREVLFDLEDSAKGPRAVNVRPAR